MRRRQFNRTVLGALGAASLPAIAPASGVTRPVDEMPRTPRDEALRVDGARINRNLELLSQFGKNPQGGVSRTAYSDADLAGRTWLQTVFRDAGLTPRIDAAGNIIARIEGSEPSLAPIIIGSHIDSVPEGGNYDGDVGTLSSIEVGRTLLEAKRALRHPLEMVCWQNEEGSLAGSRMVSGEFSAAEFEQRATSGKTLREGLAFIGGDEKRLAEVRRAPGSIAAYVELHIEQGATLDATHVDIGVVEGIVGIRHWDVEVAGFANHAGTTAMAIRHDALLAAARFVQMVNRVVTSEPGRQVGTVGRIQAFPGASNVVPGRVLMTLEMRDLSAPKIQRLFTRIEKEARTIGQANGTRFTFTPTSENLPALSDPRIREIIRRSASSLGLSTTTLPSGAGHDAQSMSRIGPMGMIFVPSVGGISHAPTEFTKAADITNGANVLLRTVLALDDWGAAAR